MTAASGLLLWLAATGPSASPDVADGSRDSDIVVTAQRHGEARIAADRELDEGQIAGYGAESIDQLLERAAPWIDASGDPPLILINGKPIGYDQSILSYPAEALTRMEVLKDEAAAEYGHHAGGRVLNLVLKRQFSSLTMDLGYEQPTGGGSSGQRLSFGRTAIQGEWRWNAHLRLSRDSALLKNERDLVRRDGWFDQNGIIGGVNGGEVDPILSDLLGYAATILPLPSGAGPWTMQDFVDADVDFRPIDPSAYESVQPKRRSASLNVGVTRPIGDFQLSANLRASRSANLALRGPAMAQWIWRAGDDNDLFTNDVQIIRPLTGVSALRVRGESQSVGASVNLNGKLLGWQMSLGLNINRSWNENSVDSGVDLARLQSHADDGLLRPWDDIGSEWLLHNISRGRNDVMAIQANASRSLLQLPAGPVNLAISVNGNRSSSQRSQNGQDQQAVNRQQGQGRLTLNLPINRGGEGLLPILGDLTVDMGVGIQRMSGSRGQNSWSLGLNHQPWPWLQLRGSWDFSDAAPSSEQLDGPIEQNVQRIFDYARQEVAEILWVAGGNPALRRGQRRNMMLNAVVRPTSAFSYQLGYREGVSRFGIASLPELTPMIEAAFPDRFFRDDDGRLVRVDARPINLERQSDSQLSHGLTWTFSQKGAGGTVGVGTTWNIQASLTHNIRLKSTLLIRAGVPVIDQLGGDSGQSRHDLSGQIGVSRSGAGLTVQGNWASGGRLRAEEGQMGLRFKPPLTLNLTSFLEPEKFSSLRWMKGIRFSLDVQNLTRQYRRVFRDDGSVPVGFGRDDVDPVGRTIRFTVRKKF